jgi:hypothetical protein
MNIELDEVVVQDVSDESLELAAGGAQGGPELALLLTGNLGCGWMSG